MVARIVVVVLTVQLISGPSASAQDHLEPEAGILNTPDFEWDYSKRLRDVLPTFRTSRLRYLWISTALVGS